MINSIAFRFAAFALASGLTVACASESTSAPDQLDNSSAISAGVGVNGGGPIEVKCERRPNRSKASVDGNNLVSGNYRARVTSGGKTVTSVLRHTVGDEVEFDFDSNRNDIAQGATPLPANFIVPVTGPDLTGEILNTAGQVVRTQSVGCQIR